MKFISICKFLDMYKSYCPSPLISHDPQFKQHHCIVVSTYMYIKILMSKYPTKSILIVNCRYCDENEISDVSNNKYS